MADVCLRVCVCVWVRQILTWYENEIQDSTQFNSRGKMTNSMHIVCEKLQALCSFSKFCHFMNRLDNKQQAERERERDV